MNGLFAAGNGAQFTILPGGSFSASDEIPHYIIQAVSSEIITCDKWLPSIESFGIVHEVQSY